MLTGEGHLYDSVSVETYFVLWKCAAVTVVTRKKHLWFSISGSLFLKRVFQGAYVCVGVCERRG